MTSPPGTKGAGDSTTPSAEVEGRRVLPDGSSYVVRRVGSGFVQAATLDRLGAPAPILLSVDFVRLAISDLTQTGGLRSVPSGMDRAAALLGAAQRNFEHLAELAREDPAAADRVVLMMLAHLRAWRPSLTLESATFRDALDRERG